MSSDLIHQTSETGQELKPRSEVGAAELLREVGAVLRMSEAEAASLADQQPDPDLDGGDPEDQTMIINMGPQHPSTHGVLRLMLELQGETVLRCKPIIGYLHTGMEKQGEQLTYMQGGTNVTRMDYLSPFFNELVFSMATEKLLGIDEEIPERAVWIRMLMSELNRMSSHLLFLATNGMDLGAVSMMIYGWREREEVLRFFQKVTGLRMNHNYVRPGGVAADLPPGWRDDVLRLLELIPPRLEEYDILMTGQPIWRERLQGVGVITPTEAVALAATGPTLRSTGIEWDLRREHAVHALRRRRLRRRRRFATAMRSTATRSGIEEVRQSIRIVHQILDRMPQGDYRIQNKKVTPPPRARIDESMEALIHHFKLFTEGFKVPEGEVYVAVESPRGELGCYIVGRRFGQAVSHAHARAELREHPVPAAHDARPPRGRRRGDHLQRRSRPRRRRPMSALTVAHVCVRNGAARPRMSLPRRLVAFRRRCRRGRRADLGRRRRGPTDAIAVHRRRTATTSSSSPASRRTRSDTRCRGDVLGVDDYTMFMRRSTSRTSAVHDRSRSRHRPPRSPSRSTRSVRLPMRSSPVIGGGERRRIADATRRSVGRPASEVVGDAHLPGRSTVVVLVRMLLRRRLAAVHDARERRIDRRSRSTTPTISAFFDSFDFVKEAF